MSDAAPLRAADSCLVQAAPGQVAAELEGEVAVLDTRSGVYYGLDRVGAAVWHRLHAPVSVAALREALVAEFDVAPDTCERDLLAFLEDMREAGLLEVSQAGD